MKLNIRQIVPPAELAEELTAAFRRARFNMNGEPIDVFFFVELWGFKNYVGVAGYGANGWYEWFWKHDDTFEFSNCGYGSPHVALQDVLNIAEPEGMTRQLEALVKTT